MLLLASTIIVPPEGADRFRVTAQLDEPSETSVRGLHANAMGVTTIVPPVATIGMAAPAGELPSALLMPIEVPVEPPGTVTVMTAATPFWMVFVLSPVKKHV
jgi:hypothetical protein